MTVNNVWGATMIDAEAFLSGSNYKTLITNRLDFGYILPHEGDKYLDYLHELIFLFRKNLNQNFRFLLSINYSLLMFLLRDGVPPLLHTPLASRLLPKATTIHTDQVYVINLTRRPDRRKKTEYATEYIGE